MRSKICPVCKNKFYSETKIFESNSAVLNYCVLDKKSKQKKKVRPVRTSTPVAELENNSSVSFSDSVTDFFYQSWKSGLHSNDSKRYVKSSNQWHQQLPAALQPFCYAPQVVYINTVIFQPYLPVQQVGYRSDGTFGVLPMYWPCNNN